MDWSPAYWELLVLLSALLLCMQIPLELCAWESWCKLSRWRGGKEYQHVLALHQKLYTGILISFLGLPSQITTNRVAWNSRHCSHSSLTVLGAKILKSCHRATLFLKDPGKNELLWPLASPDILLGLQLHHSNLSWSWCSLCVHLWGSSPCLIRTPANGLLSTLIQYDLTLTYYICKYLLPNVVIFFLFIYFYFYLFWYY